MSDTDTAVGSTVPRRTLGVTLRAARERAEMSVRQAATAIGVSPQTVWRIETGQVASKSVTVQALCGEYGVPAEMTEVLKALAKETRSRGWWHAHGDIVPAWFELYVALEQTATRIRVFESTLVPGLLQARDYMAAVIRADLPEQDQVDARVALKQNRQQLLTRSFPPPPQLQVVIGEAVLMAEPPSVMRPQLWHLLQATDLPAVSVRVLPLTAGPHRASVAGAFTLLDFPAENGNTPPSTVYSENLTGAIYLDKPAEIAAYELAWQALDKAALDPEQSRTLMKQRLKELNDREE